MRMLVLAAVTAAVAAVGGVAYADATAPTNGGNGAGMSGQCTGALIDRPASCQATAK